MTADDATMRTLIHDAAMQARPQLAALAWDHGLTRNDIRHYLPNFPQVLYLRLPDSKRFAHADDVLRAAANFSLRAEGEFTDVISTPEEVAEEREVFELGGPPSYGADPIYAGEVDHSGSATDTDGLDSTTDTLSQFESPTQH